MISRLWEAEKAHSKPARNARDVCTIGPFSVTTVLRNALIV